MPKIPRLSHSSYLPTYPTRIIMPSRNTTLLKPMPNTTRITYPHRVIPLLHNFHTTLLPPPQPFATKFSTILQYPIQPILRQYLTHPVTIQIHTHIHPTTNLPQRSPSTLRTSHYLMCPTHIPTTHNPPTTKPTHLPVNISQHILLHKLILNTPEQHYQAPKQPTNHAPPLQHFLWGRLMDQNLRTTEPATPSPLPS